MNEPVYLGLSILEMSETVIYKFWHGYVKRKLEKKQNYVEWIQIAL